MGSRPLLESLLEPLPGAEGGHLLGRYPYPLPRLGIDALPGLLLAHVELAKARDLDLFCSASLSASVRNFSRVSVYLWASAFEESVLWAISSISSVLFTPSPLLRMLHQREGRVRQKTRTRPPTLIVRLPVVRELPPSRGLARRPTDRGAFPLRRGPRRGCCHAWWHPLRLPPRAGRPPRLLPRLRQRPCQS